MDYLSTHSSLTDVLHALSQALLVPDIILLLLFAGYALFCIGSVLMEYFTERRNFKIEMPKFLSALMGANEQSIPDVIQSSGLLNRQKSALLTVFDYRTLPGDALLALIRRTVHDEQTRYERITGRNNTAAKISPMLGLMGTLIPLGPGVAALGQADPTVLSSSLLIAFDTTVAGLAVAAVCMAVGKIRSNWYEDYLSALESGMATMLQKIEDMRESGNLQAKEPSNYAFMFNKSLDKNATPSATQERTAAPQHSADSPRSESAPATNTAAQIATPTSRVAGSEAGKPESSKSPIDQTSRSWRDWAGESAPESTSGANAEAPASHTSVGTSAPVSRTTTEPTMPASRTTAEPCVPTPRTASTPGISLPAQRFNPGESNESNSPSTWQGGQ